MIEINDVSYSYDESSEVLKNITLTIKEGEFVVVLGHNGSGKSTFGRLLNALILPTKGSVKIDGIDTKDVKDAEKLLELRSKVGMVFQNPDSQLVATTVEEEIAFGPENLGVEREEMKKRIDYALELIGMQKYRYFAPSRLSGGQKQRLAIASVMAMKPKYIILDEPTSMLDPDGREEILSTLKKLNKSGNISIVLITQVMEEAPLADRVIVMDKGTLNYNGEVVKFFADKKRVSLLGLDMPVMGNLRYLLNKEGMGVPEDTLTVEKMAFFLKDRID